MGWASYLEDIRNKAIDNLNNTKERIESLPNNIRIQFYHDNNDLQETIDLLEKFIGLATDPDLSDELDLQELRFNNKELKQRNNRLEEERDNLYNTNIILENQINDIQQENNVLKEENTNVQQQLTQANEDKNMFREFIRQNGRNLNGLSFPDRHLERLVEYLIRDIPNVVYKFYPSQ